MTGLRVPTQTIHSTVAELNAIRLSWVPGELLKCISPLFVLIDLEYVFSETLQAVLSTSSSHELFPKAVAFFFFFFFPVRSVLEEYKPSGAQRNLELDDSAVHTLPCGNLTSLLLETTMGNKRRVQRLITVLVLPVNLAPSPATPPSLVWSRSSALRLLISVIPPSPSRAWYHIHWGNSDELAMQSEEQVVSFLTLFI